jgi:hypothetical protein
MQISNIAVVTRPKQLQNNYKNKKKLLKLTNRNKAPEYFKLFNDSEAGLESLLDLQKTTKNDNFVEIRQDDDLDTDTEILRTGTLACYRDLVVLKNLMQQPTDQIKRRIRSYRTWGKVFKWNLPGHKTCANRSG